MGWRFRLRLGRSRGGSLKLLETLQPMERRRLADILPANKAMVIYYLATSRRRSILVFRLPLAFCKGCSLK